MDILRIGIIGAGHVANGAHIPKLLQCENAKITAVCDINEEHLKKTADQLGVDEAHRFTDYRALIACPDVDAVEICTPNDLHIPMALDVVRAGKKLEVEKPLALSADQAQTLLDALHARNEEGMMCFSYRFFPAVRYAKELLDENILGEIMGVQVAYLKDSGLWPGRKLEWRFIQERAGTGVLGDLGAHLIDMTRFLLGDFSAICGKCRILIPEREKEDGSGMGKVTTDDECNFLAVLKNGTQATFNISRCAFGHRNSIKFEIYGKKGMMAFDLMQPEVLHLTCPQRFQGNGERQILQAPERFRVSQEQVFVDFALGKRDVYFPSIADGVACQQVLDALAASDRTEKWVYLP